MVQSEIDAAQTERKSVMAQAEKLEQDAGREKKARRYAKEQSGKYKDISGKYVQKSSPEICKSPGRENVMEKAGNM